MSEDVYGFGRSDALILKSKARRSNREIDILPEINQPRKPGTAGGSVEIYKYVLRNTMAVFSTFYRANADIFLPFDQTDTATPVVENAILYDTTLVPMATEQIAGDDGWCFKGNDGKYYVLSPACDENECCGSESVTPVDSGSGGETVEPVTVVFGT